MFVFYEFLVMGKIGKNFCSQYSTLTFLEVGYAQNMSRFRELEYLNLALNNIENVSGLENCESLRKLDLTANFIIDLQSLKTLQHLSNLEELYMIGNPCCQYKGYRAWVINHLPSLKELDGVAVLPSEKLKSKQQFCSSNISVEEEEQKAFEKRKIQKAKHKIECYDDLSDDDEEATRKWNEELTENCPETRTEMSLEIQRRRERSEKSTNKKEKKAIKYFADDGRPLNMNKANIEFNFKDDEEKNAFILEVKSYRYLSGEHLQCDVQPTYVRVMIKGQPLQIVFPSEVRPDSATALRSQVTGHLVITAPKLDDNSILRFKKTNEKPEKKNKDESRKENKNTRGNVLLETEGSKIMKMLQILPGKEESSTSKPEKKVIFERQKPDPPDFVDDPCVPPLE